MSESTIINELERGPAFVMVTHGGGVGGYALTHWRNNILDLLRLGVTKEFQGYGLGLSLLNLVLHVPHALCVLTVRQTNHVALSLYRQKGFELHGVAKESLVLVRTS
jgi:ribosomal protein S18 acetylase RimI-like enzyme